MFIIATVAAVISVVFTGSLRDPDYLISLSANKTKVILGVLLDLRVGSYWSAILFGLWSDWIVRAC